MSLTHRTIVSFAYSGVRGASDHTRCLWNVELRITGALAESPDWDTAMELPTICGLSATIAELEYLVRCLVAAGLGGSSQGRPFIADEVTAYAVRVDPS